MPKYYSSNILPVPVSQLFSLYENDSMFLRMSPPWQLSHIISQRGDSIKSGKTIWIRLYKDVLQFVWKVDYYGYKRNQCFYDKQELGPFITWQHQHLFEAIDSSHSKQIDEVNYQICGGKVGRFLLEKIIDKHCRKLFYYRNEQLKADFKRYNTFKQSGYKKIVISGASGFIGSELSAYLSCAGHEIYSLTRKIHPKKNEIQWYPQGGKIDKRGLENKDVIIHLAGENLTTGLWNHNKKNKIKDSRVIGTKLLCRALASLKNKPKVLICASAIGYYGNRSNEKLTELSETGNTFLSNVCKEWEETTAIASNAGIRVVNLRIGLVLSARGGMLGKILPIFKLGLGGVLGGGKQYLSVIDIDDLLGVVQRCIHDESISGPLNAVMPNAITAKEFTYTLAKVLNRPALFHIPKFILSSILGQMARETILSSSRVYATKLQELGFEYRFDNLYDSLRWHCGEAG